MVTTWVASEKKVLDQLCLCSGWTANAVSVYLTGAQLSVNGVIIMIGAFA